MTSLKNVLLKVDHFQIKTYIVMLMWYTTADFKPKLQTPTLFQIHLNIMIPINY